MALALVSRLEDAAAWQRELAELLPGVDFRVWPELGDGADIRLAAFDYNYFPAGVFRTMPKLGCIVFLGHGVNDAFGNSELPPGVPVMRLKDPGIIRFMVEHVLLYLLRHNRHEPIYVRQQAERRWQWHASRFAPDLRVGIMGLGSIGRRCAEVLAGLDFQVSAWSRSRHALSGIDCYAGPDQLTAFLAPCDYVVCILPETRETRDLLNARIFAAMKPGAYFINVGRGRLVVEEDLVAALDSGHLSGAALDVFRTEPLPSDSPLWAHPKIMVTPHDAGSVPRGSIAHIAENYRRLLAGQPLINIADPERGY